MNTAFDHSRPAPGAGPERPSGGHVADGPNEAFPPPTGSPEPDTTDQPPPPGASTHTVPAEPEHRSRRGPGHVIAIVVGCLMALPAIGLITGGITLAIANAAATDDGYYDVTFDRIESEGVAVAAVDLWDEAADDEGWPWVLDWLDLDIRLRVDGARSTDEVFVGIARTDDVERYLAGVAFSEVVDFDDRSPDYVEHTTDATDTADATDASSVDPPLDQDFWNVGVAGGGEQELTWAARGGDWSVVVMNADGTPGVAADIDVGIRSGAVTPIAVTLIVLGAIGSIIATTLIVVGVRGRRD